MANTTKRITIAIIAIFGVGEYLSWINGMGIAISIVGVWGYERAARGYREAGVYRKGKGGGGHKRTGSEIIDLDRMK